MTVFVALMVKDHITTIFAICCQVETFCGRWRKSGEVAQKQDSPHGDEVGVDGLVAQAQDFQPGDSASIVSHFNLQM